MKSPLSLAEITPSCDRPTNKVLTTVFQKLSTVKTPEDVLNAGVEIVYQALECDRVVVYGLQPDAYCKIMAEAVTPGYAEILGTTIQDACFEAGYIEKYRKGRVRAIDDIYKAEINACHIKNLEKIDVKSNLVVPIVRQDNSLYGLLVMHQCSKTRKWQQSEIEFALQVVNWIVDRLSQQQTQAELISRWENSQKERELLVSITQKIHGASTVRDVLQQGVDRAKELLNCDRVVVYGLQEPNLGKIVAEAKAPVLASILNSVIIDPCFEYRYREQYQQGRVSSISNIYEAGMSNCYVENLEKIGVKSNLVAPINWDDGNIYGLLVAHQCFGFKDWRLAEIEHFKQVAFHTGLSLSKAKIKEQSQSVETEIHQLKEVKRSLDLAKLRIEQIEQPLQHTSKILVEINNLNRLLEREIFQIERSGSAQTKKDTRLIQIIAKKLIVIISEIKSSLGSADDDRNQANALLNEAIACIDNDRFL